MVRLWIVLAVAATVFYIFSIVDCALAERARIRALPKPVWVLVILLLPILGGALWFTLGRGPVVSARASRALGPDDDPTFLAQLGGHGPAPRGGEQPHRASEPRLTDVEDPDDPDDRRDG